MALYFTISILVAVVMFCINVTIFSKYKILRRDSIFIITLASIVIAILFPLILNGFINASTSTGFNFALITSIITSIALVVVFSAIVAYWEYISEKGKKILNWDIGIFIKQLQKLGYLKKVKISENSGLIVRKHDESSKEERCISGEINENGAIEELESYNFDFNEDYLGEEILNEFLQLENEYESENTNIDEQSLDSFLDSDYYQDDSVSLGIEEMEQSDYKFLEDSINTAIDEIIKSSLDELGINYESCGNDISNNWDELIAAHKEEAIEDNQVMDSKKREAKFEKSIDEIIDEGFKLKEQGDYEGAIINFLYALDNHLPDDVALWVLLDICVMYKQLGQVELAKEVLENYVTEYGIVMDEALKYEIETNLQ